MYWRDGGRIMSEIIDYLRAAEAALSCLDTPAIEKASELCIECAIAGGTVFFCGNGGSAADAQHLAGELVGRFRLERRPVSSVALTANTSVLTAIANDYDFTEVFSRQIEAHGKPGDVLVAISTSGNSANVLKAVWAAKGRSMRTIAFTGSGGALSEITDACISVSSGETSHVQEALLIAGHAICDAVEKAVARLEDA
jgi:D-sedoheptulose 7-phosphate isomerase